MTMFETTGDVYICEACYGAGIILERRWHYVYGFALVETTSAYTCLRCQGSGVVNEQLGEQDRPIYADPQETPFQA
jgi:hypothetical protein